MQQMINDPAGFALAGWHWLWAFVGHADGRLALAAGALAWFVLERVVGSIYDPLKKAAVALLVAAAMLGAGTVWGGLRAAAGPVPTFESLWKTPNLQQYQQVK
jgi:hypothetical protein